MRPSNPSLLPLPPPLPPPPQFVRNEPVYLNLVASSNLRPFLELPRPAASTTFSSFAAAFATSPPPPHVFLGVCFLPAAATGASGLGVSPPASVLAGTTWTTAKPQEGEGGAAFEEGAPGGGAGGGEDEGAVAAAEGEGEGEAAGRAEAMAVVRALVEHARATLSAEKVGPRIPACNASGGMLLLLLVWKV